jgi:gamma-glutamylcyclotransferase (GGCT)/AIG2-like uncharacterized protein YtfP
MSWLNSLQQPGHITEAVIHFNAAKDRMDQWSAKTEVSRCLFDALNKIQTEWVLHAADDTMGEVKAFQTMILEGLEAGARDQFFNSNELKNLVEFEPRIMNYDTRRRHRYRPDVEIRAELIKRASEEHRKLSTAYEDLRAQKKKEVGDRVLKRAAELLYVVRSNIAHGEKTPYGPDIAKTERDEQVSTVVVPVQSMLFDMLLDYPNQKLFTYGTLSPGKPNHRILSGLEGTWERCATSGQLIEVSGLPMFRWQPFGPTIEGQLFTSPDLAKQWAQLDQFEGALYKRRMISVVTNPGISVANVYLGAQH